MAVVNNGRNVDITGLAADYDYGDVVKINSIQFVPGLAADTLLVRDGSLTGPVIFHKVAANTSDEEPKYYFGARLQPVIDFSECVLSAGHRILIAFAPYTNR